MVHHFDSEGWFSYDQVIFLMCIVCLMPKQHLSEKTIFGFPVSQGSTEIRKVEK